MNKVSIFQISKNGNFHSSRDSKINQYRVKWRVQGRDKTRSFRTRAQAEHFRRKLFTALENGETFDSLSGHPSSWVQLNKTFAEAAAEYVAQVWDSYADASKRSTVEALSYSVIHLTRKSKQHPCPFSEMTKVVKYQILHPTPAIDSSGQMSTSKDWILSNSLRLSEIDGEQITALLNTLSRDLTSNRVLSAATLRRRRQALNAVLGFAVRRQYIKKNPMELSLFRRPKFEDVLDPARFLTAEECREHVLLLDSMGETGKKVGTFVSLLWLGGLRPGEALGLKKSDLKLSQKDPKIEVRRNTVQVGKAWTNSGSSQVVKSPKSRSVGHVRSVPVPRELVSRLRRFTREIPNDGLLFPNSDSTASLSLTVFEDAWVKIRKRQTRLYDLRHTNASILIYSGLNIIEVAARLGHSVNVCSRIYLHLLGGHSAKSNDRVEQFLKSSKSKVKLD